MSKPASRVAILSFAHYHANFWAEAFKAHGGTDLVSIWDDDASRGREAAERFGVPFELDLSQVLRGCDAVAICSTTAQHPELVERSAAAGKAVLCEKPIATDMAGADRIAAAVARFGILYMQSFPKRLDPVSQHLRELVAGGELGRIHLVRIRHGHGYGLQEDFKSRWYVQQALAGGGALLDEGVHGADLLNWLFGLPESVIATTSRATSQLEVEDTGIAVYSYGEGMTAELVASFCFTAADSSIEIYGTRGTALLSGVDLASRDMTPAGFFRTYVEAGGSKTWRVHDIVPQFKIGQFHHQNALTFGHCLATGRPPPASVTEGRAALLMIVKAYAAARTGRRQYFAPDQDDSEV
jgi:myo-inositol 2-dehydrogenase / D-chiro-inositol 1-dehydrogenase